MIANQISDKMALQLKLRWVTPRGNASFFLHIGMSKVKEYFVLGIQHESPIGAVVPYLL